MAAKFIIILFYFSLNLFALSPEALQSYEKAKTLYEQQKYNDAFRHLSELYIDALDNPELNFYLGRSAYEIKEYAIALAAFERVTFLDPNNLENQIELAKTQYRLGLMDESKTNFKTIYQLSNLSEPMKETVAYYLDLIDKQQQRSFLFLTARGGILYDSNVEFSSSETIDPLLVLKPNKKSGDYAHEETTTLTHLYDIGERGGTTLHHRLSFYNRSYIDMTRYNLALLSYYPAITFGSQHSIYDLIGGFNRLYFGDNSFYNEYSLSSKWSYFYSPNFRHLLSFKINEKNYFAYSDLDAEGYEMIGGFEYSSNASRTLRTEFVASRQLKEGGNRSDVNYVEYGVNLIYTQQLRSRTIIQCNINGKKRSYDDKDITLNSKRDDSMFFGSFGLIQRLNDVVSLQATANYIRNESTVSLYDYDKHTLSLSLSGRF